MNRPLEALTDDSVGTALFIMAAIVFVVLPAPADGFRSTGAMNEARDGHTATLLLDGKVLVTGGGVMTTNELSSAELYDPTSGSWSSTTPMHVIRWGHTATLLTNGLVLVAGGGEGVNPPDAEVYDPASGNWTVTIPMNRFRYFHTATLLSNGQVLMSGGDSNPSAEVYDPVTQSWAPTGPMTELRYGHTATLLPDGRVLVAGGNDYTGEYYDVRSSAELYDPVSRTWTATGEMSDARAQHTATLLPTGLVLVAGGWHAGEGQYPLRSAELYDPASGTWTATGSMVSTGAGNFLGRFAHTATLVPDGRVLITGGETVAGFGIVGSVYFTEWYDPATGIWTAEERLIGNREYHTATLLTDGEVLVAGGFFYSANLDLFSAELYTNSTPMVGTMPVVTSPASEVTPTSATLNGLAFPGYHWVDAWFEYGTTTNYGSTTALIHVDAFAGVPVAVSRSIGGLSPGTLYHYRLVATNDTGFGFGVDQTVTVNAAGLILDDGFERGDFRGWTSSGDLSENSVISDPLYVHSGSYGASLGPVNGLGYLSRTLPTTPGRLYQISFWLNNPDAGTPNQFRMEWNGTTLIDAVDLPSIGWTNFQFKAFATAADTVLRFGFLNEPGYFGFDDVSVSEIPPPELLVGESALINGRLLLKWNSLTNRVYQLQYSTSLNPPVWHDLGEPVTATNSIATAFDTIDSDKQRFYRVSLQTN